jgi:hypothetical protein
MSVEQEKITVLFQAHKTIHEEHFFVHLDRGGKLRVSEMQVKAPRNEPTQKIRNE